jgi:hypothetical protein
MTWRARVIVVSILFLAAFAAPGRGQVRSDEDLKKFVEGLRGRVSDATFENGHYTHAGIAFDVPADWKYGGTLPDANPADDTAHWTDPASGVTLYVYLSRRSAGGEDVSALLDKAVESKAGLRARQGYRNWRMRADSVQHTSIGSRQAVVAIADLGRPERPKVERLTWIFAPESRVEFFAIMNPEQLADFTPGFDRIARSAILP